MAHPVFQCIFNETLFNDSIFHDSLIHNSILLLIFNETLKNSFGHPVCLDCYLRGMQFSEEFLGKRRLLICAICVL